MVMFFLILALVFVVLLVIITNIVIVPQSKVYVVERLGSYSDTWSAGLHIKIPFIERIAKKVAIYGSPLWALLTICALLLGIKAIALARARRHGDARQRVAAGWQSVAALARQSGLDVDGTRRDQAQAIGRQLNVDAVSLLALGKEADYAAFSGDTVQEEHVQRYWRNIDVVRRSILGSLPPARRWRARLSLADVFHIRRHGKGRSS